jgi:ATP-dependent Clp protease ATP-binding subunit ClpA
MKKILPQKTEMEEKLFKFLTENVIGQEKTMEDVAAAINVVYSKLNYQPFQSQNRPIYTALFLGPSGVGKTLTAELLAKFFDLKGIIKVNCGEYQDDGSTGNGGSMISKLIGAPKGFVGYFDPKSNDSKHNYSAPLFYNIYRYENDADAKEDNALMELKEEVFKLNLEIEKYAQRLVDAINYYNNPRDLKVMASILNGLLRRKEKIEYKIKHLRNLPEDVNKALKLMINGRDFPIEPRRVRAVILVDEIEKASEAVSNLFLSILDKGEIMLSYGETVSFRDSLIIMTSNIGGKEIINLQKGKGKLGFEIPGDKDENQEIYKTGRAMAEQYFKKPEFLNRIDWIGVFRPLSKESLGKIFDLNIRNFQDYLKDVFPITLSISKEVKNFIINQTDREEEGARLINRKIDHYIKQPLMRLEVSGKIKPGYRIAIKMKNNKIVYYAHAEETLEQFNEQLM